MFQAECDAEHDCIASSILNYGACAFFALPEFIWLSRTNKLHKRDKSSQSHSHLGTWVWSVEVGEEKHRQARVPPD